MASSVEWRTGSMRGEERGLRRERPLLAAQLVVLDQVVRIPRIVGLGLDVSDGPLRGLAVGGDGEGRRRDRLDVTKGRQDAVRSAHLAVDGPRRVEPEKVQAVAHA